MKTITKEQEARILELDTNFFKEKLETGKWYKSNNFDFLVFLTGGDLNVGFTNGTWGKTFSCYFPEDWTLATEKEVGDALTKEMVKRGYAKDNFISLNDGKLANLDCLTPLFSINSNALWNKNGCVFNDGIWATKVETITKLEAEKLLNKIIV